MYVQLHTYTQMFADTLPPTEMTSILQNSRHGLTRTAKACMCLIAATALQSAHAGNYRFDKFVPTLKVTAPASGGASTPTGGSNPPADTGSGTTTPPASTGPADFTLYSSTLDFGEIVRNQTSNPQSILVLNESTVNVSGLSLFSGADFPATTSCGSTLAANSSCTVTISFSPKVSQAALTEYLSVSASGVATKRVTLKGTSLSPVLAWTANQGDFGTVLVKTPTSRTYTLQNTGTLPATELLIEKGNNEELSLTAGTCLQLTSLAAGESCSITATLTPTSGGTRSGLIKASANQADTKNISWSSFTPKSEMTVNGSLTDTSYNFGTVTVGTYANKVFTVKAGAEAPVAGLYVSLPANAALTLPSNTCGTLTSKVTLAEGTSCSFTVRYGDTDASVLTSSNITVVSDADNSPRKISISGKTVFAAAEGIVERFATFPNLSVSNAEAINGPSFADYTIQRTGNIVTYNGAGAYTTTQVVTWSGSSPIWPISANIFLQRTSGGLSVVQYVGNTRTVLNSQSLPNFTTGGITYDSRTGYYYVLSGGSSVAGPALARFTVNNNAIGNVALMGNNQDGRAMILSGYPVVMGPDGWLYATRGGTVYRFSTDGNSYETVSSLAPPTGYANPSNSWGSEAAGIVFDKQGNALRMFNNQILSYPALGNGLFGPATAIAGMFNTSGSTNGTGSAARLNTSSVFRQAHDGTGFVISPGQVQRVR